MKRGNKCGIENIPDSRNSELLGSFTQFCHTFPEQRFWQALRNWSGNDFILASRGTETKDTFYSDARSGRYGETKQKNEIVT